MSPDYKKGCFQTTENKIPLENIRFFLKKNYKEKILPRNMPKIPSLVIDWIMYWDDGGAGFLAIRFNFHLRVFFSR